MAVLRMPPSIRNTPSSLNLSSIGNLPGNINHLCIQPIIPFRPNTTIIRMGGGPRTFPGGVSKWQWKRMQAKKQKQLLKARLCRERQIYEMRKRAELRAAISELERPWEVVERAPTLFSVRADEQLKTLADRFQKPGGYDLWSERDGPQLFHSADILPSARFLPKDSVHSIKPYGIRGNDVPEDENEGRMYNGRKKRSRRKGLSNEAVSRIDTQDVDGGLNNLRISEERAGEQKGKGLRNRGARRNMGSEISYRLDSKQLSYHTDNKEKFSSMHREKITRSNVIRYNSGRDKSKHEISRAREVYDMSLKHDGSYEFQTNQHKLSGGLEDEFGFDSTSWSNSAS